MRLTIATPAAYADIANHYAMALGYSEADGETYRNLSWQDAQGNLYALASLPVSDLFVGLATSALARPEWDTEEVIDMAKATQAQARVTLWALAQDVAPPKANTSQIVAILGVGGQEAISAMGLTPVPQDDE